MASGIFKMSPGPNPVRYAAGRTGAAGFPEGTGTVICYHARGPAGTAMAVLMWQEKTAGCTVSSRRKITSIFTGNARLTGDILRRTGRNRKKGSGMWER